MLFKEHNTFVNKFIESCRTTKKHDCAIVEHAIVISNDRIVSIVHCLQQLYKQGLPHSNIIDFFGKSSKQ